MKVFVISLLAGLSVAQVSHAQFQRSCGEQSRTIDNVLRRSTHATSELSQNLFDLNRLGSTLEQGAQVVGSSATQIDIRRELDPMVTTVENSIRSAQSQIASALADLRDTPNHGSHAYTLAGIAAGKLDSAKNTIVDAANRTADIKTRVGQLHQQIHGGGQISQVKQNIQLGVQSLQDLDRSFAALSELSRLPTLARDYVAFCSNQFEVVCAQYRSEVSRSVDRLADDQREVEGAAFELRRLRSLLAQVSQSLNAGNLPDLNSTLNGFIDRSVLPQLQDTANNLQNAASASREASTASSGVLFDQLVKQRAIPGGETAERGSSAGLSGLSGLRSTVNSVASEVSNNSSNPGAANQLRQAARETNIASRRISDVVRRLGENNFGGGDLGFASRALDDHRRYCETPSF